MPLSKPTRVYARMPEPIPTAAVLGVIRQAWRRNRQRFGITRTELARMLRRDGRSMDLHIQELLRCGKIAYAPGANRSKRYYPVEESTTKGGRA